MIGLGFYNAHNTTLDINGPFLRFTDEPASTTANDGGSVTLSGTAVAEYKHNPSTIPGERVTNTGEIKYQWYIDGVAAVDATDRISGSQTNEITISNLVSPTANTKSVFLRATYEGSAYQSESGAIIAGIARSTGNGVNEPVDTSSALITVNPTISITTQPVDTTAAEGLNASFTVVAAVSDGSDVSYQWNKDGVALLDSDTVSGSNTPTLTISESDKGTSDITVTISHPTAGNSPFTSDTAVFTVVSSRDIVSYLQHNGSGDFFGSGSVNLFETSLTLTANPVNATRLTTFYAPEKDTTVLITLAAGAGQDKPGVKGGKGGRSSFIITLEKDQEYAVKLGSTSAPTGGANGGGGAAFLYKGGRLLVAIGGGGGAGSSSKGGDGGGIGIAGQNGSGRGGGAGGSSISEGNLPTTGEYRNGTNAGRASACTIGSPYFRNNYTPCEDYGVSKFINYYGNAMEESPVILRGFKGGIAHRNNGGNGSGDEGGGGSGANGGNAAVASGSGGGGGSGYSSGEVTVLTSGMGLNSSGNAFITFEYYTP